MVFSNVLTPRAYEEKGKPKGEPRYDLTVIVAPDDPDLTRLKAEVIGELKKLYPGKVIVPRRLTQEELDRGDTVEVNVPWKDGTKEADKRKADGKDGEVFRGMVAIKMNSKFAPVLAAIENGKVVSYTDDATRPALKRIFYAGSYVVPYVKLHSYTAKDQKPGGVGLWPESICFAKHGEKLGGQGANPAEVFKGYAGNITTENPVAGEAESW